MSYTHRGFPSFQNTDSNSEESGSDSTGSLADFVVSDESGSTYEAHTPCEDTSSTSSHDGILERRPRWHREYSPYPRTRHRRRSSASERALLRSAALQNAIRPCSCDDPNLSEQPHLISPDGHLTTPTDLTSSIRNLSEQLPQGLGQGRESETRESETRELVEVLRDLALSIRSLSEQLAQGLS